MIVRTGKIDNDQWHRVKMEDYNEAWWTQTEVIHIYNHCLFCTLMSLRHWIWQIKKGVV